MNAVVKTSAFKTGNSVAVRLPKGFGIKAGDALALRKNGQGVEIVRDIDTEFERAQLAELVRRLHALGPLPGGSASLDEERIEFPDRPGLY